MRSSLAVLAPLLIVAPVSAPPPAVGVAPVSISVPAPLEEQRNPHLALGAHFDSWIVAPATVIIEPDGKVSDVMLRPIAVAMLGSKTGAFTPVDPILVPEDARRFEEAPTVGLREARFAKGSGAPRRSFVNIAWKAYGGSMDVGAANSGGVLRQARGVLARTFGKGTTFYLWGGATRSVEAKRLREVGDEGRRVALGLPSGAFEKELTPGCLLLDQVPRGVLGPRLDDGLRPDAPLVLDYPDSARRERARGIVMLLLRVAHDGSVSGVYPVRTTPGQPGFAESAIGAACRMRFNRPRLDGQPLEGLHWQHAEFSINADPARR